MKFLKSNLIFIIITFAIQLHGQVETHYSDSSLSKFVHIYMESKNNMYFRSNTSPITSLQQKLNVSDEELKVLLLNDNSDENTEYTKKQQLFIEAVQDEKLIIQSETQSRIKQLCKAQGLDLESYHGILKTYQNSTVFQNKIYPFFQAYFKTMEK